MSRVIGISDEIAAKLKSINGSAVTDKYTYKTKTGLVNVIDEVIADQLDQFNNTTDNINYLVNQSDNIYNVDWGYTNGLITNSVEYTIVAQVKNKNTTNLEFTSESIKARCSDILDDVQYVFINDFTLDALVNYIKFDSGFIQHLTTSDGFRAANYIMKFTVRYSQSISNPSVAR